MYRTWSKILTIFVFFILLFVFVKWGPAINFSTTTQTKGDPLIVTGSGKVFVTPDIAKITVGVQESGSSLPQVQENASKKTQALIDAIQKIGIDKKDIRTTSYDLYPQYDYLTSTTSRIVGYQVSSTYEIKIRNFDKINEVLTTVTGVGANMAGNISFEVNDETKKEKLNEARKLAAEEAKDKAQGLASAAGITLGKIINISENQDLYSQPRPVYDSVSPMAVGEMMVESKTSPSIEAGQTKIEVIVSLSYEIR